MFELCHAEEHLGHFDGIVPSLACIATKKYGVCDGKYLLKIPGNGISETLNFKMSLDASALRNLCLLCVFQSCLLFIISLLLKNVLTALPHSFNNIIMENQTISCFVPKVFFLFLLVSDVCVYISLFT